MALSPMRAIIAKRMPLSKAPVPHFYVTSEVAMDRAWELRDELNGLEGQPKISVTDLVIRACALALLKNPGVNASLAPAAGATRPPPGAQVIRLYHRAHIGIAVALDEGLITPVLRDCDVKPLSRIAVEARDLAERARARQAARPGDERRDVLHLEPRDVRRGRVLGHHQSAGGGDPRRGLGRRDARRRRGRRSAWGAG